MQLPIKATITTTIIITVLVALHHLPLPRRLLLMQVFILMNIPTIKIPTTANANYFALETVCRMIRWNQLSQVSFRHPELEKEVQQQLQFLEMAVLIPTFILVPLLPLPHLLQLHFHLQIIVTTFKLIDCQLMPVDTTYAKKFALAIASLKLWWYHYQKVTLHDSEIFSHVHFQPIPRICLLQSRWIFRPLLQQLMPLIFHTLVINYWTRRETRELRLQSWFPSTNSQEIPIDWDKMRE